MEMDPEAFEKMLVSRSDFMSALANDVKPAFGTKQEDLDVYLRGGIIHWGDAVDDVTNELRLLAHNLHCSPDTTLVSVMLEGLPQTGTVLLHYSHLVTFRSTQIHLLTDLDPGPINLVHNLSLQ